MDSLNSEALDHLTATLKSLLPAPVDPTVAPLVSVNPVQIGPTGLGSFVGTQADPPGTIVGRRVHAKVLITVRSASADTLNDAVTTVTRALVGAGGVALRQLGILNLTLDDIGPFVASPGPMRDLELTVLFEYLKLPTASEDVIREIPLNLTISS
jgi:hypothetical protein